MKAEDKFSYSIPEMRTLITLAWVRLRIAYHISYASQKSG